MAGRGVITDEFKEVSHPRVVMLDKQGQWVQAKHPVHFDKSVAGVGPALAFGIKMAQADPSIRVGLIPCAVGGTSIQHWQPGAYDAQTKTHPWDDAVGRIQQAMKAGVIKGVLWHQGEADRSKERSDRYVDDLTELIARVRELTGDPKLPFIMGELAPFLKDADNINRVLHAVAERVPFTAVASAAGLSHKGDNLHFDGKSASILGERFAERMGEVRGR